MKRLVLVGAGHAHLFVLERLAKARRTDIHVTLISPSPWQYYSGMVPGWMAGLYNLEQCRIDLRPLAEAVGATFIQTSVVGLHADRQRVFLADGQVISYDLLSVNAGSNTDDAWFVELGDRLLPIKPLADFAVAWPHIVEKAEREQALDLIVAGGGAAGVELAFAARHTLDRILPQLGVTLVAGGPDLLSDLSRGARLRIEGLLKKAGITLIPLSAVGTKQGVMLSNGQRLKADHVIAATGARAPQWLTQSRLMLDARGYITVDRFHRSLSHANIFAVGDICSRDDPALARSGVHAVRMGPILAHNLEAFLDGRRLHAYRPRRLTLQLLACDGPYAVASWGPFSAQGAWVWKWKDRIDRRFVNRFAPPPQNQPPKGVPAT